MNIGFDLDNESQTYEGTQTAVGDLIPNSNMSTWPAWRLFFFENWSTSHVSSAPKKRRKTSTSNSSPRQNYIARCKHCGKNVIGPNSSSNFIRHLNTNHDGLYTKYINNANLTRENTTEPPNSILPKARKEQLDSLICKMIAEDNMPLSILDRANFKEFAEAST